MSDLQAEVDRLRDGQTWVAPPFAKFEADAPIDLLGKRWLVLDLNGATVLNQNGVAFVNAGPGCHVTRGNFVAPGVDVRQSAAAWARERVAEREAEEQQP